MRTSYGLVWTLFTMKIDLITVMRTTRLNKGIRRTPQWGKLFKKLVWVSGFRCGRERWERTVEALKRRFIKGVYSSIKTILFPPLDKLYKLLFLL